MPESMMTTLTPLPVMPSNADLPPPQSWLAPVDCVVTAIVPVTRASSASAVSAPSPAA